MGNKNSTLLFYIMLSMFVLVSCNHQKQSFNEYKTAFVEQAKKDLADAHVANASFAVTDKDSIILQDNFSSVSAKTDENTPFLIGSITKVFTAVAVMQLYEQGKIDIDKPVSDYVSDFNIKQRFPESLPITIRAVLTHHAGLPSDIYRNKFSATSHDFNDILAYLNSQYTCYPVGKLWAYSNLGYNLLGTLIERVSGTTYEEYISRNIFKTLKMNQSGFFNSFSEQKQIAKAYDKNGKKALEYPLYDKPAGAIYSTTSDMIRFSRSFIDGKETLLKKKTLDQMFELQNKDNLLDLDRRVAICFNFKNKAYEIGRVFEHGGAVMYHRAQMYIAPDAGLAAVVLSDSPNGTNNAWKLNEEFMVRYCTEKNIHPDKSLNPEKKTHFTAIKSKDLKSFAGEYAFPGMICNFDWKHGYLRPTIQGNTFYLTPNDENSFVPAKRVMGIMFKSKKMHFLLEEIGGEKHFIQAMPWGELAIIGTQTKSKPIAQVWKERIGNYNVVKTSKGELNSLMNVQIAEELGFIVLKYDINPDLTFAQDVTLALDLKNNNEAFVLGYGRGGGESVIFDEKGSFGYFGLTFVKQK